MCLVFFLSLFIYLKDTVRCGDLSSLDVLIDVLILNREDVMEIQSPGK